MNRRFSILLVSILVFVSGFILGVNTSFAATGHFFAGYDFSYTNIGTQSNIPYKNPSMSSASTYDFTTEWVMSDDGLGHYIQAGWLRYKTYSSPKYFVEYTSGSCVPSCRFYYGTIDNNTHTYTNQSITSGSTIKWCGFIDGVQKDCVDTSALGFTYSTRATYSGESTNTAGKIGGSASSPLNMTDLDVLDVNSTWYQVNTTQLHSVTTSGTPYRASEGFDTSTGLTYMKNWTN